MAQVSEPKYPKVVVQLSGEDGNALAIVGRVRQAMRDANVPKIDITDFQLQALSGNYDNVLQTCMKWVTVL
jgi:hypothetical protein